MTTPIIHKLAREFLIKNDLTAVSLKVMLLDASGTVPAAPSNVSDIASVELSTTGYTRKALTGITVNTAGDGISTFTCDDVSWSTLGTVAGPSIGSAHVFVDTGSDSTSVLLWGCTVGDGALSGGGVVLELGPGGIFKLT